MVKIIGFAVLSDGQSTMYRLTKFPQETEMHGEGLQEEVARHLLL